MKTKKLRTFTIGGEEMQFNDTYFKYLFHNKKKHMKGLTSKQLEIEIGEATGSAPSAVHTWLYGSSGPSDEYKVYDIADYFEVDYRKLLVNVETDDNQGEDNMNNNIAIQTKEVKNLPKYETYSYFTKAAITRAYDMIADFIHEADIENFYCFVELAVKIKKMRGIIPYELHDKLMRFVLTEVQNMMIDQFPDLDIDDIEDGDVELANAVYETPYNIFKSLHTFAEEEMESYIGSRSDSAEYYRSSERNQEIIDAIKKYKQLEDKDITYENISHFFERGQIILKALVDTTENHITEIMTYGCDYGRQSYISSYYMIGDQHRTCSIEYHLIPFYNFKSDEPNDWCAPIDIGEDGPNVISTSMAIDYICDAASKGAYSDNQHYEFYVSKGFGDFSNAGGPLELDFIESWMINNGYS